MKIENALIGYSGFVGSNLMKYLSFDKLYNTSNIDEIQNNEFCTVVCAGAYGVKWKANKYPDKDLKSIEYLIKNLKKLKTKKLILISTVDVYPVPYEVDENTYIDSNKLLPYGKHRRQLELMVANNFDATVVRLPTIFGFGIKKNVIFDLMNTQRLSSINKYGVYQFYNLNHLWTDIQKAVNNNIHLLNIATEPVSIVEVGFSCFNIDLSKNDGDDSAPNYKMDTKYGKIWGHTQPYLYTKDDQLREIAEFVKSYQVQENTI